MPLPDCFFLENKAETTIFITGFPGFGYGTLIERFFPSDGLFQLVFLFFRSLFVLFRNPIMTVAYLRISTEKQHLRNQREEILRFASFRNLHIDRWLTEVVSGRKSGRERKLGALLKRMKRGDTLIVTELSRLSRTLTEIMSIMGLCLERGVVLYSTKDGYAFDDSINSKVLCFAFGLVAEIERNLISMRTREALAVRRADGVALGRRKGSCVKQQALARQREEVVAMLRGGCTLAELCRTFSVSPKTFHRFRHSDAEIDAAYTLRNCSRAGRIGR